MAKVSYPLTIKAVKDPNGKERTAIVGANGEVYGEVPFIYHGDGMYQIVADANAYNANKKRRG